MAKSKGILICEACERSGLSERHQSYRDGRMVCLQCITTESATPEAMKKFLLGVNERRVEAKRDVRQEGLFSLF